MRNEAVRVLAAYLERLQWSMNYNKTSTEELEIELEEERKKYAEYRIMIREIEEAIKKLEGE